MEVSKIVAYYLQLVLRFWHEITLVALHDARPRSLDLWLNEDGSWGAARLRSALEREAATHLNTKLNIAIYRHVAIAIARIYLQGGSFKRDYMVEQRLLDQQAAHKSWEAACIYARGAHE